MTSDRYHARLLHAQWTWREAKCYRKWFGPTRNKDARMGRAEKRSARQQDRAEMLERASGRLDLDRNDNVPWCGLVCRDVCEG